MAASLISQLKDSEAFKPEAYYNNALPDIKGAPRGIARCPFHADNTPSLSIDFDTGKWYCHAGCGNGDVLDFEAKLRGTTIKDKDFLKSLAKSAGIELKNPNQAKPKKKINYKPFNLETFSKEKQLSIESLKQINATEVKRGDKPEICIPMVDASGKQTGYRRRFPMGKPTINKGGHAGLIVPNGFQTEARYIFIMEGETDLAAACMLGINALAVPGTGKCADIVVDVCRRANAEAIIVADNDLPDPKSGNRPGQDGAKRIAKAFNEAKRPCRIWVMPIEKQDFRDWMLAGGTKNEILKIIESLPPAKVEEYLPESYAFNDNNKEPTASALARDFLNLHKLFGQIFCMRFWRGEFFEFDGHSWQPIEPDDIKAQIWRFSEPYLIKFGPNKGKTANIVDGLKAEVFLPPRAEMPFWISPDDQLKIKETESTKYLSCKNGLLEIKTRELHKASPLFFTRNNLPVDFDPDAEIPHWLKFLNQIFENDQTLIDVLQEWFGYCLIPDNRYQRFLMMQGEGANGKSQVIDVLTSLLGVENVAAVPLDQFGDRFGLLPTIGRLLNTCGDAPELDRIAEGYIKAFTSGDMVTFDRKHIPPVTMRPVTKLLMACNNPPRFNDKTQGIWRRMIMMPFEVVIPVEKQVKNLGVRLFKAESSGILNWTLAGMARLQQNGTFTNSERVTTAQRRYQADCNPVEIYLDDNVTKAEEGKITKNALYDDYKDWCKRDGFKPLNSVNFGKAIHKYFPNIVNVKMNNPHQMKFNRVNGYRGIAFSEDVARTINDDV